ncbi:VOC family protein [Thalassobacillus sp. CUG 92003]|uniref:VOC family protein n=1 Tax=Thalassobacillus sp. CUG 92003 TaxID=2736641 RepID=UPI0021039ED8|nr:VOC family protein [Thalassobacillus sp. CUG 92003]
MNLVISISLCNEAELRGWHHIGIETSCLARTITFYTQLIDFHTSEQIDLDDESLTFLTRGSLQLELVLPKQETEVSSGHVHFAWKVNNLTAWVEWLKEHNVFPVDGPYRVRRLQGVMYKGPNNETIELICSQQEHGQ